jgi:hypothetical protein
VISIQLIFLDLKGNNWFNVDVSNIESKITTVKSDDNIINIGTEKGLFEQPK